MGINYQIMQGRELMVNRVKSKGSKNSDKHSGKSDLDFLINDKFDVFFVSESKLDSSFPEAQSKIPGYRIFRQDRYKYGGGLMFYINQNIPCKKIETFQFTPSIEILTLNINLGNEKLLAFGTHKSPSINNSCFLNERYNLITLFSTKIVFCLVT